MFVEGKSRTVFFPSDTLIYGISRDGQKNYNIRTCEYMILGQLRMGAREANYAPMAVRISAFLHIFANIRAYLPLFFAHYPHHSAFAATAWPPLIRTFPRGGVY